MPSNMMKNCDTHTHIRTDNLDREIMVKRKARRCERRKKVTDNCLDLSFLANSNKLFLRRKVN